MGAWSNPCICMALTSRRSDCCRWCIEKLWVSRNSGGDDTAFSTMRGGLACALYNGDLFMGRVAACVAVQVMPWQFLRSNPTPVMQTCRLVAARRPGLRSDWSH